MSVDWNSLPPQMQVEDSSAHDFRIALAGQSFYGIVNVNSGVIYLVAGGPVIRSRSWFGSPMVPDFIRDPIRATFSRGGQAGHAYVINRCGLRHVGSHLHYAGFSVIKKTADDLKASFRSSLNRSCFDNNPMDDEEVTGRLMPERWTVAIINALNRVLGVV